MLPQLRPQASWATSNLHYTVPFPSPSTRLLYSTLIFYKPKNGLALPQWHLLGLGVMQGTGTSCPSQDSAQQCRTVLATSSL